MNVYLYNIYIYKLVRIGKIYSANMDFLIKNENLPPAKCYIKRKVEKKFICLYKYILFSKLLGLVYFYSFKLDLNKI